MLLARNGAIRLPIAKYLPLKKYPYCLQNSDTIIMVLVEAISSYSVYAPKGKLFCLFNSIEAALVN